MWTSGLANLTCDFIKKGLHHGHITAECSDFLCKLLHKVALITCKGVYFFSKPNTYYFDRDAQGQLPKQKHSPKVILEKGCSKRLYKFYRKETLMKFFLEYLKPLLF